MEIIKIAGDTLEAGGQIVRTALALSTLTQKPFEVNNIRKGRSSSGLKNQHLYCIKSLQELCNAKTEGASLGSEHLKFIPSQIKAKNLNIDIETAGSITLLLQSVLLPCFFANKKTKLEIIGGTDTKWSMPIDYFKDILMPQLNKFCEKAEVKLIKRGYYPKGNGKVEIKINPKYKLSDYKDFSEFHSHLKNENIHYNLLEQEHLIHVKGISHASSDLQKANVAERQAKAAELTLNQLNCPVSIRTEYHDTLSTGSGITLWAIFSKEKDEIDINNPIRIGADSLGERGKKAGIVGNEAAERLIKEISYKAPVDGYLADNLIPWLALFKGKVKVAKITNHTLTNIYVVEQFLGKMFEIDKENKIISTIS